MEAQKNKKLHLPPDVFLIEYQAMLTKAATKGTCFVSMKQYTDKQKGETVCLLRARLGDSKISTTVKASNLLRFQIGLAGAQKAAWGNTLPKNLSKRAQNGSEPAKVEKAVKVKE